MLRIAGKLCLLTLRIARRVLFSAVFLDLAFAAVVVAVVLLAAASMARTVYASREYRVDLGRISVRLANGADALRFPWIARSIRADLERLARGYGRRSTLDPAACELVAARLARNPWVEEVVEVAPEFPSGLKWHLRYRLPAAAVELGRHYALVDKKGRRLPVALSAREARRRRLLVITGLPADTRTPRVGEPFTHPGVPAAISVIEHARTVHRLLSACGDGVSSVDVTFAGSGRRSEINMITSRGALIEWGRPARGGRLPLRNAAGKFRSLRTILARDGSLKPRWRYRLWTPVPAAEPPETGHE